MDLVKSIAIKRTDLDFCEMPKAIEFINNKSLPVLDEQMMDIKCFFFAISM
jgi:hypothetical protein